MSAEVRPILLQKDGAIKGTPGAYRTSPPPIAGPYAGSDIREDVTFYTVNSAGEAELKTVKAYVFYCDSVSGGLDTSGDGMLSDPWKSINYALSQLQPKLSCLNLTSCCTYLVLRVRGTIDYAFYNGVSVFNGYDRLIIEPWNIESVDIDFTYIGTSLLNKISYCVLKNFHINIAAVFTTSFYEKWLIGGTQTNRIVFNDLNLTCNVTFSQGNEAGHTYLFYECAGYTFYKCGIEVELNSTGSSYVLFDAYRGCDYSIFYEATCSIQNNYDNNSAGIACFLMNNYSVFYSCNVNIQSSPGAQYPIVEAWGFHSNLNGAFHSCIASASLAGEEDRGCGFYQNTNASYFECTGYAIGSITCDI